MLRKHIDFVAIFFIAFALLAFSRLSSLRMSDFGDSVHFQNALVSIDSCPAAQHVLSLLNF